MSETLQRILLSELKRIRLTCGTCNTAVEVNVDQVSDRFADKKCKFCGATVPFAEIYPNIFAALKHLAENEQRMRIEFIIPQNS